MPSSDQQDHPWKQWLLVLVCAAAGGLVGYAAFFWIVAQGFYALVLPGGLLGLCAGIPRNRSVWPAIVCGLFAIALGLFAEWRWAPFAVDGSLAYFVLHVHELKPLTLVLVAVGGAIGFWVPFRRSQDTRRSGGKKGSDPLN